eukprot:3911457-Rhodomonas_salina.1
MMRNQIEIAALAVQRAVKRSRLHLGDEALDDVEVVVERELCHLRVVVPRVVPEHLPAERMRGRAGARKRARR